MYVCMAHGVMDVVVEGIDDVIIFPYCFFTAWGQENLWGEEYHVPNFGLRKIGQGHLGKIPKN